MRWSEWLYRVAYQCSSELIQAENPGQMPIAIGAVKLTERGILDEIKAKVGDRKRLVLMDSVVFKRCRMGGVSIFASPRLCVPLI